MTSALIRALPSSCNCSVCVSRLSVCLCDSRSPVSSTIKLRSSFSTALPTIFSISLFLLLLIFVQSNFFEVKQPRTPCSVTKPPKTLFIGRDVCISGRAGAVKTGRQRKEKQPVHLEGHMRSKGRRSPTSTTHKRMTLRGKKTALYTFATHHLKFLCNICKLYCQILALIRLRLFL